MPQSSSTSVDSSLLEGIRRHLEGLKRTADGLALYDLIESGLKRHGGDQGRLEYAFISYLYALLGRYAKDPQYDPATRIKARLIQQRLMLHLSESNAEIAPSAEAAAVMPAAGSRTPAGVQHTSAAAETPVEATPPPAAPIPETVAQPTVPPAGSAVAQDERTEADPPPEVVALERDLADRLAESLTQSPPREVFGGPGVSVDPGALADFGELRQILVRGLDDLIRERRALLQKINSAAEYLKAVEADRERLVAELHKARSHSLVDELTGLPKREVFLRSLDAEIGRVRRYGFAFALALIDIDALGEFNRRHGREAGDAVLRCYAAEVLSRFRAYDLVARYGDDEFAILFPNTQKEGAMHALEKARKQVAGTFLQYDGRSLPLPGFSSVLTVYTQGDKPAALLERAAEALDQARRKGPGQLVVTLPST